MDISIRAKMLGYLGAANVHIEYRIKKNSSVLEVELLRLCSEIYGVTAESLSALASQIDELGRGERKRRCKAYRAAHSLEHPQRHKHQEQSVLERLNDFPDVPQKLNLVQNQAGYVTPPAPRPVLDVPSVGLSPKKLRKLQLAAKKEKRAARRERRRAALNEAASKPRVTMPSFAGGPSETAIREFYKSWDWKRLSYDVKLERGRRCECCGAKAPDVRIHTDHVKPIRRYWDRRLDRSNLQVLCEDCNMGKGSRDETDFRASGARQPGDDPDTARQILDGSMPADTVVWN